MSLRGIGGQAFPQEPQLTVEKVDIWGKRRLAYEIAKHAEGIYVVIDLKAAPATVSELDRQLSLNESVLRTKVMRTDKH